MKNIVLLALLLCGASPLYSQGAMVVTDPTSFAQRAMNFVDQMAEAVEEKYVMYEQIEQMVMQAEDFKKNAEKFKTAMNWVKRAKDFVVIVQAAEDMANDLNEFRNQLTQTDWLNEGERLSLWEKAKFPTVSPFSALTSSAFATAPKSRSLQVKSPFPSSSTSCTGRAPTWSMKRAKAFMFPDMPARKN